jgi:hypothetical protein
MKSTNLLTVTAAIAISAFALGLAINALALPAFAIAASAFFALIVAHDYAPRRANYANSNGSERLPYAA